MEARGEVESRAGLLRMFVMDHLFEAAAEVLRWAVDLEVVAYPSLEDTWPVSLPLVSWLSLSFIALEELASYHMPSLRVLRIDCVRSG